MPTCSMYGIFTYIWVIFWVNVGNIPAPWSIWDRIECVYSIECCSLPDDSHVWVSKVMGGPQARWMVYFMENTIKISY